MYHVHFAKDNSLSEKNRIVGNEEFAKAKFFDALMFYNKSLCLAINKSKEMALAYGNRAAVYLELKEFDKCMENIKMARDAGYPEDNLDRLVLREERCLEQMQSHEPNNNDDPWNFFKLSYPPNEQNPDIANCLELCKNEEYGRHIITNRDLKPGDIIGVEETPFKVLTAQAIFIRCANCFKSNKMSLIPLETCPSAMFCSQECLDYGKNMEMCAVDDSCSYAVRVLLKALSTLGGDIDKLEQLMKDPELRDKTVFDLDLSNPGDPNFNYNQLLSFNSIYKTPETLLTKSQTRFVELHPILNRWSTKRERNIVTAFMLDVLRTPNTSFRINMWSHKDEPLSKYDEVKKTSFKITMWQIREVRIGHLASSFSSLFNHSCFPNADYLLVDNKFVVFVTFPIKKGEQIYQSYGLDWRHPIKERVYEHFNFLCSCAACKNDWNPETIPVVDRSRRPNKPTLTSIKAAKEEYARNCDYIRNHSENFPCKEILHLQINNVALLKFIAKVDPLLAQQFA